MARDMLPCIAMIIVQVGGAVMNIISKVAMDSGMNSFVMVTYRQIFATFSIIPFVYYFERKTMPKITKSILIQLFFSSILGATGNQCLFFLGLKYTTPTIASALNNLAPAITFVMAIPFGIETVGIKRRAGQAKVIGTVLCVGGAMLMSFYKGSLINIGESSIRWTYAEKMREQNDDNGQTNFLGPVLVVASCTSWSAWFILQAKMGKTFSAPYASTALMCFMASIQCGAIGAIVEHDIKEWSLASNIRLVAAIYNGVVGSAFTICIMSWCIDKRGPLYVSMFNPLLLVIVAVLGWALVNEALYVGSVLGSVLIIVGLYSVLWGKGKEINEVSRVHEQRLEEGGELPVDEERGDMELVVQSKENVQNAS